MAVSEAQVLDALRPVQDPELHMSIVDLDMVRGVTVADGSVRVVVALTVSGCPLRAEITQRVTSAVAALPDVANVDVDLTVMTEEELAALRSRLQGGGHAGHGHAAEGQAPQRPMPFADPGSSTRVLGIASGKGGVGKSSVTVNLAIALRDRGHDVAVLDADIYGFSVPKMLGVTSEPTVLGEGMVLPPVAHDIKVVSMGYFVEEEQAVIWRGPMLHKALNQFLTDFFWGEPAFLLVDMPPGTGDIALSMSQYLPRTEIYIVTTPQPAAQRVAQRSAFLAKKVNLPVRGVIENMSWFTGDDGKRYDIFGEGGGRLLAESLDVPLLVQVPLVPELRDGGDTGLPITVAKPDSEPSRAFAELARAIDELGPGRVYRPELKVV